MILLNHKNVLQIWNVLLNQICLHFIWIVGTQYRPIFKCSAQMYIHQTNKNKIKKKKKKRKKTEKETKKICHETIYSRAHYKSKFDVTSFKFPISFLSTLSTMMSSNVNYFFDIQHFRVELLSCRAFLQSHFLNKNIFCVCIFVFFLIHSFKIFLFLNSYLEKNYFLRACLIKF